MSHDFSEPIWSDHRHLKEWRKRVGASQEQLAEAAGVVQSTVSALERDIEPFTKSSLKKIWGAIAKLNAEFLQRQALIQRAGAPDTSDPIALLYADPRGEGTLYLPSGKTPLERERAEYKALIERYESRIAVLEREYTIAHDYMKILEEEKKELLGMLGWRVKKTVEDSEQIEAEQKLMGKIGAEKIPSVEEEELRAEIEQRGKKGSK